VVVFVIGILAIVAGESLSDSIDSAMGRVVGVTLLILGVYVLYALIRYRQDFRLRSRWMLIFESARNAYRWVTARVGSRGDPLEHEHEHVSDDDFHHHEGNGGGGGVSVRTRTHTHSHKHDPFMNYGTGTSVAVGALHGVGAETPTQVLIFLAAAGAGGATAGVITLGVFLVGLFAANSALAIASASGFLAATRHFAIYATVSVVTAVASLVLGVSFVLGKDAWLPVFFGG
jgi:high-affinity nickel-transport protein